MYNANKRANQLRTEGMQDAIMFKKSNQLRGRERMQVMLFVV
jgi:hypothetical protein